MRIKLHLNMRHCCGCFERFKLLSGAKASLPKRTKAVVRRGGGVKRIRLTAISFKRSFRVAPIRLTTAMDSLVGKNEQIAPRFKITILGPSEARNRGLVFPMGRKVISRRASGRVERVLRAMMSRNSKGGTGVRKCTVNKGATASRALPEDTGHCVSSFLKFTPTRSPRVLKLYVVRSPGKVCCKKAMTTPIVHNVFRGVLPCLKVRGDSISSFSTRNG